MCGYSTEENTNRYDGMKNKAMKVVSKAMREKVVEALAVLMNCPNRLYRLIIII